ncbi:MAG: fimbrillin family protein [Prevotella sp.]|nr:fimbrillin family protein [Prevotella sp.]
MNTKFTIALAAMALMASCSETEELVSPALSGNKITFSSETVNAWQSGEGSASAKAAATRAVNRINDGGPLVAQSSIGRQLYIHPVGQVGVYFHNAKDQLVTRTGQLIADATNDHVLTRGSKSESVSDPFLVSAYYNTATGSSAPSGTFFDFAAANSIANGKYRIADDTKTWPTTGSLDFYAYMYNGGNQGKAMITTTAGAPTTLHYKASSSDIINQPDLRVAQAKGQTRTATQASTVVPLTFNHVLTAITFAASNDMVPGTVKSVTIKGVYGEGDYNCSTLAWSGQKTATSYSITTNVDVNGINGVALTTGSNTLMMVPQTCPAGATLEIVFNNGSADRTITASIAGQQWTAGSSIIYQLSTSKTLKLSVKAVYPKAWTSASDVKAAYVNDDKLGMYVVDQNNSVIHANVPVTYNGSAWTYADNTVSEGKHVQASPKYQYFFYYPYNATAPTVAPAASTNANTFFANKINNWKPTADQSSESTFNAQDLQVGKGVINGSATSFDASMAHSMGLAQITLGTKTIPLTRTFYMTGLNASNNSAITTTAGGKTYASKGIAAYMQYYQGQMKSDPITATSAYKTESYKDADGVTHNLVEDSNKSSNTAANSRSVTAAANFEGEGTSNRPCLISGKYYAVVKPSTATTFYSKDGIANGWGNRFTDNRVTANVAANSLSSYTAHSDSAFIFLAAAYSCAGKVEEFQTPAKGEYKLEVWGSVGGDDNYPSVDAGTAGNGGYSYGNISVNAQKSLFVCVGGNSCYNGGGVGQGNGGDATHIAYISGLLKEFKSNYTSVLLIVAGGGGGVNNYGTAGYGGGGNNSGGTGSAFSWGTISSSQGGEGGTQTGGGKSIKFSPNNLSVISVNGDFGMGGYGYVVTPSNDYGGGGGAGFYGGGGTPLSGTGGGGSGYLSPLLTKSGGQNGTNSKLGKATITEVQ